MAVNRDADFYLNGKPFMLVRSDDMRGRAWSRTGVTDEPSRRTATDTKYGRLDDKLDHPEVWEDWSAGYGDYERRQSRPGAVHWSENFDLRFPGQAVHCQEMRLLAARYASQSVNCEQLYEVPLPGVASPPVGAGAVLALGKGFLGRFVPTGLNTGGSAFDAAVEDTGGGITFAGRPATYGSYTYVGNAAGSGFYARGHDGTVTVSSMPAEGFITAGGRLWRRHGKYLLQSIGDTSLGAAFTATAWSATLSIGNGQMQIGDMVELGDQLFCGLPDGLYAGDQTGSFYNVLAELRDQKHPDNCRDLDVFQNGILTPNVGGLMWFRPSDWVSEARDVGPQGQASNRSPVKGRIRCVASFGAWVYAGLWTGSNSYILAGRESSAGLPYVWTVQQRLPHTAQISRIHFDSVTSNSAGNEIPNRCWVLTDPTYGARAGATAPVYWWPIPRGNDNPIADMTFSANYVGSARMDLQFSDWQAPATPKLYRVVEIEADNLLSGVRYADVYYSIDGGSRTLMGRAQESPKSTLYFPATEEAFATGYRVALSIESFTASQNTSPIYRSVVVRGALRPNSVDTITAVVRVADGVRDRRGKEMRRGGAMLEELRDMARGRSPQKLIDLAGATSWVVVVPPVEEQEVYQKGDENPELAARIQMAVLDFTLGTPLLAVAGVVAI